SNEDNNVLALDLSCQPGKVFSNVRLQELLIPIRIPVLIGPIKLLPALPDIFLRLAPVDLNFTVQAASEPGALCAAQSDVGKLSASLFVSPNGPEKTLGYLTGQVTVTLFDGGPSSPGSPALRWHTDGFQPFGLNVKAPLPTLWVDLAQLGLKSTTPFEMMVRAGERYFHEQLKDIILV